MIPEEPKIISISIPESMYVWLEEHKQINRSQVFRDSVKVIMDDKKKKVSSLLFLATIIGEVMGIALIGISVSPTTLDSNLRGLLALLGGILAVVTSITYFKERRNINA